MVEYILYYKVANYAHFYGEVCMVSENTSKVKGLVSIIMPIYNAEKYLSLAIDSVLKQSYTNWELWLINDASKDSSLAVAEGYAAMDARIKAIDLEKNSGVAVARNKGLELARGEYIAFLDADDIWISEKLEKQLDFIEKNGMDVTYTAYNMIDSKGNITKNRAVPKKVTFNSLLLENVIIFSTVLLKSSKLSGLQFNSECFHEDYLFSLELLKKDCAFGGINESLVEYRVYEGGKSFNKLNAAKERWKIYRDYLRLGVCESLYCFINYAIHGVLKYI